MPADYQVQLDVFSGPLDLLLYLVRKEEIELYDLSLERLTAQYVGFLEQHAVALQDLDTAGDFIAVAAHLLYLKSRRLLPPEALPQDEESADNNDLALEDPRWELIRQLLEYKKFKQAGLGLGEREGARLALFARPVEAAAADVKNLNAVADAAGELLLGELSTLDLLNAFGRILRRLDERERGGAVGAAAAREIYEERFTVGDKINELLRRTEELVWREGPEASLSFEELFSAAVTRTELVVTFLALLELVRLKRLRVAQPGGFEEIRIFRSD